MPYSSKQVTRALVREGFAESDGTGHSGSHRTYYRLRDQARSQTVTVVLGKREIPPGTLRNYARQLGITLDELIRWLDK